MPEFLEKKLRQEYAAKGKTGESLDHAVYGTLNALGAMHGSTVTAKGERMQAKHERDVRKGTAKPVSRHPHKNLGTYLHPKKGR